MSEEDEISIPLSEFCRDADWLRPDEKEQVLDRVPAWVKHEKINLHQGFSVVDMVEDRQAISDSQELADFIRISLKDSEEFAGFDPQVLKDRLRDIVGYELQPIDDGEALIFFPENGETAESLRQSFDAIRSDFGRAAVYQLAREAYKEAFCSDYIDKGAPLEQEMADAEGQCKKYQAYEAIIDRLDTDFGLDGLVNDGCEEKPMDFRKLNAQSAYEEEPGVLAGQVSQEVPLENIKMSHGYVIDASQPEEVRLMLVDSSLLNGSDVERLVQSYNALNPHDVRLAVREIEGDYMIDVPDGDTRGVADFLNKMLSGQKNMTVEPTGSAELAVKENSVEAAASKER